MEAYGSNPKVPPTPFRAFLSFASKDKMLVDAFRYEIELLHPTVEFVDHAVQDRYDEDWKYYCSRKICDSPLLICLVGPSTHESAAVAWEIDRGMSLGKRIVAVHLTGRSVCVPEILERNGIKPSGNSLASFFAPTETQPPGE